ncbi:MULTISPECIES: hypothetical protein [Streptomyces]|uniref:DUF2771 domain-containing protein n=1 Tax=Streptomyces nodosus TaxID=40318 RepID=A0A0B5DLE1_9ACTN|nr:MULTISPECIES: hypothetical protein [Streptomyces]AJE41231.1 lipoprotein [Streptomyces nodosus]MBB4792390.1 hypothetical protein [Streptomyces nodosus]MYV47498.1 DUF2771 domain-containing protein [Streptomyces sp. SID2888]QEV39775.1 DUF2771 domain-containing protein [Streptomyces nodosus]
MTALPSRRAVAALGAVSAGLLLLSACTKPTPMATLTVGTDSVSTQTDCYKDGKEVGLAQLKKCLDPKLTGIKSIKVDPDETVRFGVDPSIAENGWAILMNGQPLTDSSTKTYRTIPGSVFFNAQYGATGNSTLVSVREGETKVTGLWSFKLEKSS